MQELRTGGMLVGKYGFTDTGFVLEYKLKKRMVTVFLPLYPELGMPIVTIK